MARWIALLLLLLVIAAGVRNEPAGVEQRLHGKVVLALADEDLSAVRVQLDGRKVLLSGPEKRVPQALEIVENLSGVRSVETRITAAYKTAVRQQTKVRKESREGPFAQVIHPSETYWPVRKNDPVRFESELLVTKVKQSVEVNGAVPNYQIKREILVKIEQLIDIPEHLFDVSVNKANTMSDGFLQDLPLIIPFVQWVEEGRLQYRGNRILLDGIVLNRKAWKAIETAIANIPSKYQIENRLHIGTN